ETAAKDSAARAAAMPAGWRPGERAGERAGVAPAPADVAAVEEAQPASLVEDLLVEEPAPPINLVPVTPRLRPSRASDTAAAPPAGDLMPTADLPLTIIQP